MLDADDLAIIVLDNAGWHRAKALTIPPNLLLLPLPSYSPELNPTERLWLWLRSHHLANRTYADYDDLLHAADTAMAESASVSKSSSLRIPRAPSPRGRRRSPLTRSCFSR